MDSIYRDYGGDSSLVLLWTSVNQKVHDGLSPLARLLVSVASGNDFFHRENVGYTTALQMMKRALDCGTYSDGADGMETVTNILQVRPIMFFPSIHTESLRASKIVRGVYRLSNTPGMERVYLFSLDSPVMDHSCLLFCVSYLPLCTSSTVAQPRTS